MPNRDKREVIGNLSLIFLLLLFALLCARMLSLYMKEGIFSAYYRDPEISTRYFRGTIYDRSKNILAMDRTSYIIEIDAERVSEKSRLTSLISPYIDINTVILENMIRSSENLELESNIMMEEAEGFTSMLKRENMDHVVRLKERRERIYPQGEHGMLIIGMAEQEYDNMLTPPLSLDKAVSEGNDLTLSLSERIEYVTDHLVDSYISPGSDEYLMLAVLDYATGEIYALSQSADDSGSIDFNAIEIALNQRPYTILKSERSHNVPDLENYSITEGERHMVAIYRFGFAYLASSSSKEIAESAAAELSSLVRL